MRFRRTALLGLALSGLITTAQQTPPAGLSPESGDLFREVYALVLREYVDPKTPQEVVAGAIEGAAHSAGPECAFIPPEEAGAWRAAQTPAPSLPLYVTKGQDFAHVLAVWPGTDDRVRPGDSLRFIGGRSTYDMDYPEVVRALRGAEGESVSCIFLKPDTWEMYTVPLARKSPPDPTLKKLKGGAILALPSLEAAPTEALKVSLSAEKGPLLLDLRGCASGDTAAALRWAGWLVGPTASVTRVFREEKTEERPEGPGIAKGRIARCLIDETTARGGEVLASALARSGVLLVGAKSLGWAPRFEDLPVAAGGLLRLSTAFYATPSGEAMRKKPLEPAILIAPKEGEKPDLFLQRAMKEPPPPAEPPAPPAAPRGADGR